MHEKMTEMLTASLDTGRGVTLYLPGHEVSIVVTELVGTEAVVGRNQEYGTVLIRLDQVHACAAG